jgi:hypothetical protein
MVEATAEGVPARTLKDELLALEQRQEALAAPEGCDEATLMRRQVELGLDGRRAARSAAEVCSVKVVAGAGFEPATFRL